MYWFSTTESTVDDDFKLQIMNHADKYKVTPHLIIEILRKNPYITQSQMCLKYHIPKRTIHALLPAKEYLESTMISCDWKYSCGKNVLHQNVAKSWP